jgi:hypothetical protein
MVISKVLGIGEDCKDDVCKIELSDEAKKTLIEAREHLKQSNKVVGGIKETAKT